MRQLKTKRNNVRSLIAQGKQAFGAWLLIPTTTTVEVAGYAGLDFAVIDNEQGGFNDETIVDMIRCGNLVDMAMFVRVVDNHAGRILKILNMGADGIIVPHVRTRADAEAVVRAARYAPQGFRGQMTGMRRDGYGTIDTSEYLSEINQEIMVFLVIEDVEALDNLDEIATTPGVDVLLLGPEDMAQSLGVPGQPGHERVAAAAEKIHSAARAAGIAFFGDQLIDAGIDQTLLLQGWQAGRKAAS